MLPCDPRLMQPSLFDSTAFHFFLPTSLREHSTVRRFRTEKRQNEVALTHEELRTLEDEIGSLITEYQEDIRTGFIVENSEKLRRVADRFREYLYRLPPKAPRCNAPWVSAVVDVDGSVRPCFFHPVVSNLKQLTLQEAVNSEAALNFRGTLDVTNNPTCQRCVCSLNYRQ